MSILDDLKALQTKNTKPPAPTTNDSYISDAVVQSALFRAGVPEETIRDVLQEPVESRDWYMQYFEGKANDNK